MILSSAPRKIRVMITTFRDGLQSSFGGKVRLNDVLPAMEAAARAGIRHFEFGGGARYQAPYFYGGEDPFDSGCVNALRTFQDAYGYVGAKIEGFVYGSAMKAGEIKKNKALLEAAFELGKKLGGD